MAAKRTNPAGNQYGSDSDEDDDVAYETLFSSAAQGKFRSRALDAQSQSQFPTQPLYELNEEVYLLVVGQSQPAGPYTVATILEDGTYRLNRKDNGQEVAHAVRESELVIRTP